MAVTAIKMFGSMAGKTGGRAVTKLSPLALVSCALDVVDAGISVFGYFRERGRTKELAAALASDRVVIDRAVAEHWSQARVKVQYAQKISQVRIEQYRQELNIQLVEIKNRWEEQKTQFVYTYEQKQKEEELGRVTRSICRKSLVYMEVMVAKLKATNEDNAEIEKLFSAYEKAVRTYAKTLN